MAERTRFIGKATGHKVDEDQPTQVSDPEQIHRIMVEAKVSEEDAKWLVQDGYWGRIMHMVRSAVVFHHAEMERSNEDTPQ